MVRQGCTSKVTNLIIRKQQVNGSNPFGGSSFPVVWRRDGPARPQPGRTIALSSELNGISKSWESGRKYATRPFILGTARFARTPARDRRATAVTRGILAGPLRL